MAQGITIDARKFTKGVKDFKALMNKFPDRIDDVLDDNAEAIKLRAQDDAPANIGGLRQGISVKRDKPLERAITSRMPYSAYVEFGTGAYAAQEVSKLPSNFKQFAAQFKSDKGKRSIKGMLKILMIWFQKKGIKDKQHQYFIARKIVQKGTHPHPFMLPALFDQAPKIIADLKNLINKLRV